MIDRNARSKLASLIRRYLNEDIKAFDFDDALDDFRDSPDTGVAFVSDALWYHYDDCVDHLVVLSKPQWDYFQRLLLLLDSNSTVTTTRRRKWGLAQVGAAALLIACGCIIFRTGFGPHLFIFFIPFGVGSIVIDRLRRPAVQLGPYDAIVTPFGSIRDLRIAYTSTLFRKRRYPELLDARKIRSLTMDAFGLAYLNIMWSILAPFPLLVQCLPTTVTVTTVNPA